MVDYSQHLDINSFIGAAEFKLLNDITHNELNTSFAPSFISKCSSASLFDLEQIILASRPETVETFLFIFRIPYNSLLW